LITNYERVRDGQIDPRRHDFCGVSLDEGSVLRSMGSKTSETAAFVLMRHRFSAMIVRGGMQSIQPAATPVVEKAVEPVAMATVVPSVDAVLPRVDNSGATDEALLKMYEKLKRRNAVLEAENKALEEQCASLMALVSSLREQLRAAED
jgi:hypothetical protein